MKQTICTLALLISCVATAKGTNSGGGGNVCVLASGSTKVVRILELAELPRPSLRPEAGVQIPYSQVARYIGFDEVKLYDGRLKESVEARLQSWEEVHPLLVHVLRKSITSIKFFVTPYIPKKSVGADFGQSRLCQPKNTFASIIYQNYGAFVSIPLFNAMDLESQTAVLLHEGARVMQKEFKSFSEETTEPKDADLQQLVVALMRGTPNENLYSLEFIKKHSLFMWVDRFTQFCEAFESWSDLKNQPEDKVFQQREICRTAHPKIEKNLTESVLDNSHALFLESLYLFPLPEFCHQLKQVPGDDPNYLKNFDNVLTCALHTKLNLAFGVSFSLAFTVVPAMISGADLVALFANFNMGFKSLFTINQFHKRFEVPGYYSEKEIKEIDKIAAESRRLAKPAFENITFLKSVEFNDKAN